MKGPFEYNKVYAIAAVGKAGFAGGIIPAVYAYDTRTDEGRFFTVGRDEAAEAERREDVYTTEVVGELMLDSAEEAGYRVPERQVLSLWSQRDEAVEKFKARSERGKVALANKKKRLAEERAARARAADEAHALSAEGRIEALPGIRSIYRVIRGDSDTVLLTLRLTPKRLEQMAVALGIDEGLLAEWLVESASEDAQLKVAQA